MADGPDCIWARFSFSRERRSAASERARASPSVAKRAGDGELAALAAMSSRPRAGRAGSGRLRPGHGRGRGAGAGRSSSSSVGGRCGGLAAGARRRLGGAARLFLGGEAGGFGASSSALAIVLGAALLVLGRGLGLVLLAAARFLERGHARLFGLAQQVLLTAPCARSRVVWRGAAAGFGRGLGGAGDRLGRGDDGLGLRRLGLAGAAAGCGAS